MAVARIKKLFIVVHKSEEKSLLKHLQKEKAVEIAPYTINEESDIIVDSNEYDNEITRINAVLNVYNKYKGILGFIANSGKIAISKNEYNEIINNFDYTHAIETTNNLENEIQDIDTKLSEISSRIHQLSAWVSYKENIEDLGEKELYTIKLGNIAIKDIDFNELIKKMDENSIDIEVLNKKQNIIQAIIAYHNDNKKSVEEFLNRIAFEEADISGKGKIEDNIDLLKKSYTNYKNQKENMLSQMKINIEKFEKGLIVFLDYFENNLDIENAINSGYSTNTVSFYTCWVKSKDVEKFINMQNQYNFTRIEEMEIKDNENIPIILENKKIFQPFEIVTNLYGVPRYFEIDPTPFLSLFFAMFFGLCLTDAGYGIILAVASFYLASRMKNNKNFMYLMGISGIFTVFAGASFNGWFGDLPSYIGMENFFNKFAIFGDPIKTSEGSMNFFRLALALGVIQIFYGLFIKFFDSLRLKEYGVAFLDTLTWIVLVGSLLIMLLSNEMAVNMQLVKSTMFPSSVSSFLGPLAGIAAIVIVLFGARNEKSLFFRFFMGFLNLTILNGITAFLGDFLSYIRLMALGLVTAGIGVAINKIAFDTLSVPYAGFFIMLIILLAGHTFNIAINVLGAFVHTLRLQYVEFFQKFYEGGGKPFNTLKEEHKYVIILDE